MSQLSKIFKKIFGISLSEVTVKVVVGSQIEAILLEALLNKYGAAATISAMGILQDVDTKLTTLNKTIDKNIELAHVEVNGIRLMIQNALSKKAI